MFTVTPPPILRLLLLLAVVGQLFAAAAVVAQEEDAAVLEEEEDIAINELEDGDADQLAVASSPQEQLVELPSVGGAASPLAFLLATAAGSPTAAAAAAAGPILPLAPQHFRPKRKPQRFGGDSAEENNGRQRFRPRSNKDKKAEAVDGSANEIPRTAIVDIVTTQPPPPTAARATRKEFFRGEGNAGKAARTKQPVVAAVVAEPSNAEQPQPPAKAVNSNKFSSFLRRPRPLAGGATVVPPTVVDSFVTATTEEAVGLTEIVGGGSRFVEFVPTASTTTTIQTTTTAAPTTTTTTSSRFQLEDFFGTPESVAASEVAAAAAFSPSSARLVEAPRSSATALEDISENLILDEVRSRTAAITGAQAVGVSRELSTARRDGARQLQLQPAPPPAAIDDAPLARESSNGDFAQRPRGGDEARKGAGRRPAPAAVKPQQQQQQVPRKEQALPPVFAASGKRGGGGGGRADKETVGTVERYRQEHEDGSITWGYENEDGSYKEETIGIDCITHGKYGYIDPTGEVREYAYTSGVRCDPLTRQIDAVEQQQQQTGSRGPNGHGYFDYAENKFVMADGRRVTVVVNQRNKARGTRY